MAPPRERAGSAFAIAAERALAAVPPREWSQGAVDAAFSGFEAGAQPHRELLGLFLTAPEDERMRLAGHIANTTPDEDFLPLGAIIIAAEEPADILDPLVGDLHERPIEIKLPVMAEILALPDHPFADEARKTLATYLGQEFGVPGDEWRVAVDSYLAGAANSEREGGQP